MKLIDIEINQIGGVNHLLLNFSENMNIICGPNGIGKSTILESISFMFSRYGSKIKKNIRSVNDGDIHLKIHTDKDVLVLSANAGTFEPNNTVDNYNNHALDLRYLIRFNTTRHLDYSRLEHISIDPVRSESEISSQNNNSVLLYDIKGWLAKRYLLEDSNKNFFSKNSKRNLELALSSINILNRNYKFSHIDGRSFDIFVTTPNGVIWYEYLSSGFKSCLAIIIGIIKEIEIRFTSEDLYAAEFKGIILIDEIEIHLHPEWQGRITEILVEMFPMAQFIVTTHSPHVVQNSKPDQIIALEQDDDGETKVRSKPNKESGYTGWTIDEVLRDVMGMESTLSKNLQQKLTEFYKFIDAEDYASASSIYNYLDDILHPKNVLRKSLAMSLDMIQDIEE